MTDKLFLDLIDDASCNLSVRALALDRYLRTLAWFVPESLQPRCVEKLLHELKNPAQSVDVCVFKAISQDNVLSARRAWRFFDFQSLIVMYNEIFVREEYFFPADNPDDVVVIDFGANIGLAELYFKYKYPKSRIICFEPNPQMYKILSSNLQASRYENIEATCAAVGAENGVAEFWFSSRAPMAGRIGKGQPTLGQFQSAETVVMSVRDILEPIDKIDLLKLDIEGSEVDVISAAGTLLRKSRFIFVECHPAAHADGANTLGAVLQEITRQGFKCHVGRTAWSERDHTFKPLRHACQDFSACVYAVRMD